MIARIVGLGFCNFCNQLTAPDGASLRKSRNVSGGRKVQDKILGRRNMGMQFEGPELEDILFFCWGVYVHQPLCRGSLFLSTGHKPNV